MRVILGLTSLIFVAAVFWGSFNLGVFKTVKVTRGIAGPHYMIGKPHTGAYHEISPVITEVEKWARSQGLSCITTFGFYTDDPNIVESVRLRSRGGCLMNEDEKMKAAALTLPEKYSIEVVAAGNYLMAYFDGSPWIGPYKVYGKAEEVLYAEGKSTVFPVIKDQTDGKTIQTTYYFRGN